MKKRQNYFDTLKAFFVRHTSEYKTSDSDRKVNRKIYPDAVTRDGMCLIDPKSGQLELFVIAYVNSPNEDTNLCLHKTGF